MWTRRQLMTALRQAGWTRVVMGATVYRSPNGTHFQLDRYSRERGVLWKWYASREVLPDEIPETKGGYRDIT